MKACDEKFKSSLLEAMELDEARLEEEMKNYEPHVFSESFENRMDELFKNYRRKQKLRSIRRYAVAAVLVLALAGGIFYVGSRDLRASETKIDILEWLENFFTVEDGTDNRKEENILFEESQIGYLPEGFEKVDELISFSQVMYEYEDSEKEYITIRVLRDKLSISVDSEVADKEERINKAGYEYTMTQRDEAQQVTIMWKDDNDIYYYVTSTLGNEELIKIMDGISY